MAQIVKLKRSNTPGAIPESSSLEFGELAINYSDGKVFFRKNDESVQTLVATNTDTAIQGDLNITGSVTASFFVGDGSQLENITVDQASTVQRSFTNSSTWVVNHNLDAPNAIVQVYDNDNFLVIPSTVQKTDDDTFTITFDSPQSGYAVVAKGGHIVSGSIPSENIDGLDQSITNQVNVLGVFSGSEQVTLSGDVTGTAAATVINQIDGGSI